MLATVVTCWPAALMNLLLRAPWNESPHLIVEVCEKSYRGVVSERGANKNGGGRKERGERVGRCGAAGAPVWQFELLVPFEKRRSESEKGGVSRSDSFDGGRFVVVTCWPAALMNLLLRAPWNESPHLIVEVCEKSYRGAVSERGANKKNGGGAWNVCWEEFQ
jgi:hypothetical protein